MFLRPDADSVDGTWLTDTGGTSLFAAIDETSFSDADYIQSVDSPVGEVCKIRLSDPSGPVVEPLTVRARFKAVGSASPLDLTVRLLQGASVIAEETFTSISTSFTTDSFVLTSPEFAAITDFTDLYLEFEANTQLAAALLLDGISNLGPVWSFRRLLTAYSGNCVRIRRSSDSAEQNFGFVSDVVDTAGIASFVGGGSGFIVTWFDQNGNVVDITQATAGMQPQFIASSIGSLPGARFVAGNNTALVKTSVSAGSLVDSSADCAMFVVQTQVGSVGANTTFSWADGSAVITCHATYGDTIYFDCPDTGNGRINVSQPSGWDDTPHVLELVRETNKQIIVDGVSLASTALVATSITGTSNFAVGNYFDVSLPMSGDVSELVFIKDGASSTERETIRRDGVDTGVSQSMGDYYGISVV